MTAAFSPPETSYARYAVGWGGLTQDLTLAKSDLKFTTWPRPILSPTAVLLTLDSEITDVSLNLTAQMLGHWQALLWDAGNGNLVVC